MRFSQFFTRALIVMAVLLAGIAFKTVHELLPFSELEATRSTAKTVQVVDRNNIPLSISYQNQWNSYDYLPLHQMPTLLQQAFVLSEDQHFYYHRGVDWSARAMALWHALRSQKITRGASTLSEQVVRMLHPRPRTLWSKWLESIEVVQLERQLNKLDILEFYLNEVPYAANRRGVLQAARYYFNRDLSTLSTKEMLALVVLARAPSSYDLYKNPTRIDGAILRLATRLQRTNVITQATLTQIAQEKFDLKSPSEPINASHFVNFLRMQTSRLSPSPEKKIRTTLDAKLQQSVQALLDQRLKSLSHKGVHNAGALVVDHQSGEIVAWVVAGANRDPNILLVPSSQIDTVTTPRQPGSALKPFLYTLALELGWSPTTIIDDSPLADVIDHGYHQFANYSHKFYGAVTLRQALGNSLNIPALRTIKYTGVSRYLETLHQLGFTSLQQAHDFYDEGLALGNGEVTLFELVQANAALAHHGQFRPLQFLMSSDTRPEAKRVFSDEASSLIANILSDPKARQLEFGAHSILNLPVQTAVKTGTSSDYHDAWAVGFNHRYVVGIWMGNLDHTPMRGVTGALGPALTLRSIFAELNKNQKTEALYLSPRLIKAEVCIDQKQQPCTTTFDYFIHPPQLKMQTSSTNQTAYKITLPTPDLQIALDPRITLAQQQLPLQMNQLNPGDTIEWIVNGKSLPKTTSHHTLWPLIPGHHTLSAIMYHPNKTQTVLPLIRFIVK